MDTLHFNEFARCDFFFFYFFLVDHARRIRVLGAKGVGCIKVEVKSNCEGTAPFAMSQH